MDEFGDTADEAAEPTSNVGVEAPEQTDDSDSPLLEDIDTTGGEDEAADSTPLEASQAFETQDFSPQAVLDQATDVPGGKAFYEPGDTDTLPAALALPEFPGEQTYDLHGTSNGVVIPGRDDLATSSEFAQVVKLDPTWDGKPIRLFSCDTGKIRDDGGTFAKDLANELGVPVTAPTELAWSGPGGTPFSASECECNGLSPEHWQDLDSHPVGPPYDGEFKQFDPDGAAARTLSRRPSR
jgi:hypothetical protein